MSDTNDGLDRRGFLKIGAAGIAATALSACATTSARKDAPLAATSQPSPAAAPRALGRTGLKLPPVSMGVMTADNPNLVRAALEGGMTLLDTAHGYQEGRNEEMIGTVIKGRPRESFVLCTKIHLSTQDRKTGLYLAGTRPEEFGEMLEISLERLGLDYVDVLYMHGQSVPESAKMPALLEALEKLKQAGKTRFLGVSTHKNEPDIIRAAIEAKVYDVVLTSYNFHQEHRQEVQKAIAEAAAAGLGVVAMKALAGVYWDKEKKQPINAKAALKWVLRDPNVHTAILGFTAFDQLQSDLEVLRDPVMTDAELRSLEPPVASLPAHFYCHGCQSCRGPCRADLPVPELMRSYMYAHAYRNRAAAQELVLALDLPAAPCADCTTCAVHCPRGFDVRERIRDVTRLRSVPSEFLI